MNKDFLQKAIFPLIFVVLAGVLLNPLIFGQSVAILKSSDTSDFNAVRNGFISVYFGEYDEFDCQNDMNRAERNIAIIKAEGFNIIFAIGNLAMTAAVENAPDIMILGTMIPNPDNFESRTENLSIIGMFPPINTLFDRISSLNISALGLLYNPDENHSYVQRLRVAANAKNIDLVSLEVNTPRLVPASFQQIQGQIDAFLFLSDSIYSIKDSVDFIIQTSNQSKIKTIAPTNVLVSQGALISISADYVEIGRLSANRINDFISGKRLPIFTDPTALFISINAKTARDIGFTIPGVIERDAKEVIR